MSTQNIKQIWMSADSQQICMALIKANSSRPHFKTFSSHLPASWCDFTHTHDDWFGADEAFFGIIGTIGVRACMQRQRPTPKTQCDIFCERARANNSLVDALRNNFQRNVARYKSALCVCVCRMGARERARILRRLSDGKYRFLPGCSSLWNICWQTSRPRRLTRTPLCSVSDRHLFALQIDQCIFLSTT